MKKPIKLIRLQEINLPSCYSVPNIKIPIQEDAKAFYEHGDDSVQLNGIKPELEIFDRIVIKTFKGFDDESVYINREHVEKLFPIISLVVESRISEIKKEAIETRVSELKKELAKYQVKYWVLERKYSGIWYIRAKNRIKQVFLQIKALKHPLHCLKQKK